MYSGLQLVYAYSAVSPSLYLLSFRLAVVQHKRFTTNYTLCIIPSPKPYHICIWHNIILCNGKLCIKNKKLV